MSAIGVIGGTGVYDPSIFENIHEESLMTLLMEKLIMFKEHIKVKL